MGGNCKIGVKMHSFYIGQNFGQTFVDDYLYCPSCSINPCRNINDRLNNFYETLATTYHKSSYPDVLTRGFCYSKKFFERIR